MSKNKNISIFRPFDFKNQFVDFNTSQEDLRESLNDFFIHDLKDKSINLRLPLPPHRKTVNDFFIVTEGFARRHVGITCYDIGKNELLSVPKLKVSTTDYYSENIDGFYFHFSDQFLADNSLLLNCLSVNSYSSKMYIDDDVSMRIIGLLSSMNILYRKSWAENKLLIAQYLRTVITEINFQTIRNRPIKSGLKRNLAMDYISLINANINKGYTISKLAEMLNISPNHLNKSVKSHLGKSAQSVLNDILLQEAKVLLLQTSKDIGEIAYELGFNDVSYFGKFFKKMAQQTPMQYRKMIDIYH